MISVRGQRLSTDYLSSHHYVCDLLRAELPVLSLYTDGRENWLYLWVDTDSANRQRYLLFTASREALEQYLKQRIGLLRVIEEASLTWLLDETHTPAKARGEKDRTYRHLQEVQDLGTVAAYLPTKKARFDPELAPDIDVTKDLLPKSYGVPIAGDWFSRDFAYLFKRYERIYAFFYATGPRFVRPIEDTLRRVLRAPWKGGYSRVNLYTRLAEVLPAQHALKVDKLQFASPGDVKFEAIPSIGESIARTIVKYLEHETSVDKSSKRITTILRLANLNRKDLSDRPEKSIKLSDKERDEISAAVVSISTRLAATEQFKVLREHSPNSVVYAKAVVSFVRQVEMLSKLQRMKMLNLKVP
jgi:hypothetical protein